MSTPPSPRPKKEGGPDSGDDAAVRRRQLIRYAGVSSEVFASVGIAVFLGMKADKWAKLSFPVFSLSLPLLVIVVLLVQLVKGGSNKKNGK
ncbi:MAG TPA: hypothetical protein VHE54_15100 [Puia sp.]|nr:hypothetical protein [Puia sp.]